MSRLKSRTRRIANVKAKIQDKDCQDKDPGQGGLTMLRSRSKTRMAKATVKAKIQDKEDC
jgi:hypothetical protein